MSAKVHKTTFSRSLAIVVIVTTSQAAQARADPDKGTYRQCHKLQSSLPEEVQYYHQRCYDPYRQWP